MYKNLIVTLHTGSDIHFYKLSNTLAVHCT